MAGTFFKALNWVANEFLVEKLANNRAFQRVALRMHEKETKMAETVKSEMGNQKASEYLWSKAENLGKQASEAMAEGQTKAPEGAKYSSEAAAKHKPKAEPKVEAKPPPPPPPQPEVKTNISESTSKAVHGGGGFAAAAAKRKPRKIVL